MAFVRLLAILLGSIIVGLSLPQVANVRFKAMISLGPAPGLGRSLPVAGTARTRDRLLPTVGACGFPVDYCRYRSRDSIQPLH
jgi:hypothetical protein